MPSFEELLAKGSFHARLAQARLKRERLLAESGDDGFILDTSRKPWDRAAPQAGKRAPMDKALGMSVAAGAASARPEASAPAGADFREPSAKVVPIRQGGYVPVDARAEAAPAPAADLRQPEAAPIPEAAKAAPARRAAILGGGLLCALAAAAVLTWPQAQPLQRPSGTAGIAPETAAQPHPAPAAIAVPATPSDLPAAPRFADSRHAAPAPITGPSMSQLPAPGMALAGGPDAAPAARSVPSVLAEPGAAPGLALPSATDISDSRQATPAPITGPSIAQPSAPGMVLAGGPDTAPAARSVPSAPAGPGAAPGLALPSATVAAGPGAVPRPDVQPDLVGVTLLAAVTGPDAPVAGQGNPPAAPVPAGPVIVNAPESVGEAELAGLVEGLAAGGFVLSGPNRVDLPISESNVRFFHSADAAAAQALAERIGARLRDFTDFSPAPPAGTIEVWLAGRGNAPAARRASGQRSMTAEERELDVLRSRILRQLRNGEHL